MDVIAARSANSTAETEANWSAVAAKAHINMTIVAMTHVEWPMLPDFRG